MASLYIKDGETNAMAERFAAVRGVTKTAAVKLALQRALEREASAVGHGGFILDKLEAFWRERGIDGPSGPIADKAFYDSLNDEDDD